MKQYKYSTSTTRVKTKDLSYYVRNFSRIFMGVLFICSSYVKMVDPFGFALKIEEYFVSFSLNFMTPTSMFFAFAAILAEFIIGWALLLKIQMKITSWFLLLFMLFFTVLTFWLAYALDIVRIINNLFGTTYEIFVVTDCGCFGDFIKLTNHQTFYKNLIFLPLTLIIFFQRKKFKEQEWYYITQWGPILLATILGIFVMTYCLRHEPWHDFRPWKIGNFIAAETYSKAPEMDFVFKYKNKQNGEIKEFTMSDLNNISDDSIQSVDFENNYVYVERTEKIIQPGINARLADFSITNSENIDIKDMIINQEEYNFIIFIRDFDKLNSHKLNKIQHLITDCEQNDIAYVILSSTASTIIDSLKPIFNFNYDIFSCDATSMKTAIRNDPGVILLKQGYILDKWAFRDVPTLEKILLQQPKYEENLQRYKQKNPPIFPDITTILENEESENEAITSSHTDDVD